MSRQHGSKRDDIILPRLEKITIILLHVMFEISVTQGTSASIYLYIYIYVYAYVELCVCVIVYVHFLALRDTGVEANFGVMIS